MARKKHAQPPSMFADDFAVPVPVIVSEPEPVVVPEVVVPEEPCCEATGQPIDVPPDESALSRGDALRAAGIALPLCWLPDPQPRFVHPRVPEGDTMAMVRPGEIPDGPAPGSPLSLDERIPRAVVVPEIGHEGPRDVAFGDRWLSFHFPD